MMWLGALQKEQERQAKTLEQLEAAIEGNRALLETLKNSVMRCDSEIKRLDASLLSSSSSVLKKSVEELELWKADLMARLMDKTPTGRPRLSPLGKALKRRW